MALSRTWRRIVGIVAALWNLAGCVAFVADLRLTAADLAAMPAAQQHLYAARPTWALAGTGIAVTAGLLGSVLLAAGHRAALPLLVLSLAGVVVQDAGLLIAYGGLPTGVPLVLQGVVLLVAIGLVLLARRATAPR